MYRSGRRLLAATGVLVVIAAGCADADAPVVATATEAAADSPTAAEAELREVDPRTAPPLATTDATAPAGGGPTGSPPSQPTAGPVTWERIPLDEVSGVYGSGDQDAEVLLLVEDEVVALGSSVGTSRQASAWTSADGGASWASPALLPAADQGSVSAATTLPGGGAVVVGYGDVERPGGVEQGGLAWWTDDGRAFQPSTVDGRAGLPLQVGATDGAVVFLDDRRVLWRSTDGGRSFVEVREESERPVDVGGFGDLAGPLPLADGSLLIVGTSGGEGATFRSTDDGATWGAPPR